jgi:hypothetical protein
MTRPFAARCSASPSLFGHHLPRPGVHLDGRPTSRKSSAHHAPDERGLQRLHLAYSSSRSLRLARGYPRRPEGIDSHRPLVVGLHHGDRCRLELRVAGYDSLLFGAGEPGFPGVSRAFSRWFPRERGRATDFCFGSRAGGAGARSPFSSFTNGAGGGASSRSEASASCGRFSGTGSSATSPRSIPR